MFLGTLAIFNLSSAKMIILCSQNNNTVRTVSILSVEKMVNSSLTCLCYGNSCVFLTQTNRIPRKDETDEEIKWDDEWKSHLIICYSVEFDGA